MSDIVDRYLETWNETDPEARRRSVAEVFTPDATYTDPLAAVGGHDGIDAVINGAQQQLAGMHFVRGELVDAHHDIVRFTWHLVPAAGGDALVDGFDVARLDDGGRITGVFGFLDRVPQG